MPPPRMVGPQVEVAAFATCASPESPPTSRHGSTAEAPPPSSPADIANNDDLEEFASSLSEPSSESSPPHSPPPSGTESLASSFDLSGFTALLPLRCAACSAPFGPTALSYTCPCCDRDVCAPCSRARVRLEGSSYLGSHRVCLRCASLAAAPAPHSLSGVAAIPIVSREQQARARAAACHGSSWIGSAEDAGSTSAYDSGPTSADNADKPDSYGSFTQNERAAAAFLHQRRQYYAALRGAARRRSAPQFPAGAGAGATATDSSDGGAATDPPVRPRFAVTFADRLTQSPLAAAAASPRKQQGHRRGRGSGGGVCELDVPAAWSWERTVQLAFFCCVAGAAWRIVFAPGGGGGGSSVGRTYEPPLPVGFRDREAGGGGGEGLAEAAAAEQQWAVAAAQAAAAAAGAGAGAAAPVLAQTEEQQVGGEAGLAHQLELQQPLQEVRSSSEGDDLETHAAAASDGGGAASSGPEGSSTADVHTPGVTADSSTAGSAAADADGAAAARSAAGELAVATTADAGNSEGEQQAPALRQQQQPGGGVPGDAAVATAGTADAAQQRQPHHGPAALLAVRTVHASLAAAAGADGAPMRPRDVLANVCSAAATAADGTLPCAPHFLLMHPTGDLALYPGAVAAAAHALLLSSTDGGAKWAVGAAHRHHGVLWQRVARVLSRHLRHTTAPEASPSSGGDTGSGDCEGCELWLRCDGRLELLAGQRVVWRSRGDRWWRGRRRQGTRARCAYAAQVDAAGALTVVVQDSGRVVWRAGGRKRWWGV